MKSMGSRKKILSLVLLALIVLTFAACSGSQKTCPAYGSAGMNSPEQKAG
jgi:hypothetical protein